MWGIGIKKAKHQMSSQPNNTFRRDPFVDNLRGIFHLVMVVDHLPFVLPGVFTLITGLFEVAGYITVAEGFVFLSGFVSGLVYTRLKREKGGSALWRKILLRAVQIHVSYVLAAVSLLALIKMLGPSNMEWHSWNQLIDTSLTEASVKVALVLVQPTFLEILPMYCLFLLLTPILLDQIERGRCLRVILVSVLIWGAAQLGLRNALFHLLPPHVSVSPGYFNAFGWQILFVSGLVCGHKTWTARGPWLPTRRELSAIAIMTICVCFILHRGYLGLRMPDSLIDRSPLGPLRLINFFAMAFLLCKFRTRTEKYISWGGLAFLSRHSLPVFAFHLIPIYLVAIAFEARSTLSTLFQLIFIGICVGSLFQIALLAQFLKNVLSWSCARLSESLVGMRSTARRRMESCQNLPMQSDKETRRDYQNS